MAEAPEKTAEELAAEERELAIKRGDIIPEDDVDEAVEASTGGEDEPEAEGDGGGEELEAADAEGESDEAEGEGEKDSTPKAGAEGEGEEEKPIMIPKARFDEAQRKAREKTEALEAKLKKAEREHVTQQTSADIEAMQNEITELEDKWEAHLMEGEEESAKAVCRQLNIKRNELVQRQLLQQSQQTGNAAVEQIRYETKLAFLEEKFPVLNPDSDKYDEAVMTEVAELKAAFEGRGWSSTAALEKAVHYAIREEKAAPPVEDSTEERKEVKKSQRAHQARKAAAAAQKAVPPDASRAGRDSDKGGKGDGLPDVSKMTPDQFAKWADENPSAMSQLRGDSLSADEAAA